MSYGVKYRNGYTDILGVSHRVDILEDGYSGAVVTVQATRNPVIFSWDPDDGSKYATSIASSMDINLRSPSRQYFKSLFTASKFKYQVIHYTASVPDWVGFLLPDLYSEIYESKDFAVSIKAADGLGLLGNMDFVDGNGDAYTGLKTDFDIIKIMLDKIGNTRGIYTAINIYETTMTVGNPYDPLKQVYTNCDIFNGMTCADVLREILKPYGAVIFQDSNGWNIVRFSQLSGSYVRRIYNTAGTYLYSETHDPVKSLTDENATASNRNVMIMGSTSMNMIPAIQKLFISQDYGKKDNLLPGGDFNIKDWEPQFASNEYRSNIWKMHIDSPFTIGDAVTGYVEDRSTGEMHMAIFGYVFGDLIHNPSMANYAMSKIYLSETEDQRFALKLEYRLTIYDPAAGYLIGPDGNRSANIFIIVKQGSNILDNNGVWVNWTGSIPSDFAAIKLFAPSSVNWNSLEIPISSIPNNGDVEVRVYRAASPFYKDPSWVISVDVKKISFEINGVDTSLEFVTEVDQNNNYIPDTIDIMSGDAPDITNGASIYSGAKLIDASTTTKLWKEVGSNIQEPLVVSLARIISNQYLRPTVSYDALIRHAHLTIGSVIDDPWDLVKYRVLAIRSNDVAECEVRATLAEIIYQENLVTESGEALITESDEPIFEN